MTVVPLDANGEKNPRTPMPNVGQGKKYVGYSARHSSASRLLVTDTNSAVRNTVPRSFCGAEPGLVAVPFRLCALASPSLLLVPLLSELLVDVLVLLLVVVLVVVVALVLLPAARCSGAACSAASPTGPGAGACASSSARRGAMLCVPGYCAACHGCASAAAVASASPRSAAAPPQRVAALSSTHAASRPAAAARPLRSSLQPPAPLRRLLLCVQRCCSCACMALLQPTPRRDCPPPFAAPLHTVPAASRRAALRYGAARVKAEGRPTRGNTHQAPNVPTKHLPNPPPAARRVSTRVLVRQRAPRRRARCFRRGARIAWPACIRRCLAPSAWASSTWLASRTATTRRRAHSLSSSSWKSNAHFRLFYPTEAPAVSAAAAPPWLPHWRYARGNVAFVTADLIHGPRPAAPRRSAKDTARAIARSLALLLGELLVLLYGWVVLRLPARAAAPLAPPSVRAPPHGLGGTSQGETAPGGLPERLSAVLFTHGLGGMRNSYSWQCCALASTGRVVAALEHGDATACVTRLPHRSHGEASTSGTAGDAAAAGRGEAQRRGGRGVWLKYAGCGVGAERWSKVARRCAELTLVTDVLSALAACDPTLPHHATVTWPSSPRAPLGAPSGCFLSQFRGRIDARALVVAGHSFGGGTAVAFARADSRIAAAVTFDPWLPACAPGDTAAAPWPRHAPPLLALLSEPWARNGTHDAAALRRVCTGVRAAGGAAAVAALHGSSHHTFSDAALFVPSTVLRMLRGTNITVASAAELHAAIFRLTDAFLRRHVNANASGRKHAAAAATPATQEEERAWEWCDEEHTAMVQQACGEHALLMG